MSFENVRRIVAAAFALGLAAAVPAPAQEERPGPPPESAPESEFFESIDVSVVNVEVYVTDKKGERVRGLTRDDFELFENGRPVAITNFYAVDDGRPALVGEVGDAQVELPEPPAARGVLPADIPEEQRLHLVVYIDNWNIKPLNRNRVFVGLREFLRTQLSPGDRVMLMTYDRTPHVRRNFTTDPATIAAALFEIEKLSANGARLESDRRELLRDLTGQESQGDPRGNPVMRARTYAQELFNDLSFSLDSIRDLVETLAGLPGRKAVLYVSDGLQLVPGEDIFHALQQANPTESGMILESRSFDLSRRFREIVAAANSNRVSFYTIDAAGLRTSTASSVETRDPTAASAVDSIYFSNLQSSIRMLADGTGGLAVINSNDARRGLELIAEDFQSYYSLGYAPAGAGSGRYNEIEVRAKRKGLRVRHRDGYRDKPIETRMADGLSAALNFGFETNTLGLEIERGAERPRDDGFYLVPISVRIPIGGLTLVPQGGLHVGRARLFIGARDEEGSSSEVQEARVPIEIPDGELAAAQQGLFRYDLTLVMRRGPQRVAVGLRDEFGQTSSFTVKSLRIGG